MTDSNVAFIVGCGRSGTTILADTLNRIDGLAHWYEPYFIWDYHLGQLRDNLRQAGHASETVRRFIRREFQRFQEKSRAKIVVDKSPEHCFAIPFIREIFPEAKWIHLIRDGRDVTVSMYRGWRKRAEMVRQKNLLNLANTAGEMLGRQPFWRNRMQAVWFELKSASSLNLLNFFNKSKWEGNVGYGARFNGWREALAVNPVITFNAMQWAESVTAVRLGLADLSNEQSVEIRYEQFVCDPYGTIQDLCAFLNVDVGLRAADIEHVHRGRVGGWQQNLDIKERELTAPVLNDLLIELGYAANDSWVKAPPIIASS